MLHHDNTEFRTEDIGEAILNNSPPEHPESCATRLSVILPVKNEAESLKSLLTRLRATLPQAELILLGDGSSDQTAEVACVASHPYSFGNVTAVKPGARVATGEILIFTRGHGDRYND
jgi:glycosyltransferase involved in cell wall biosynthesis